MDNIPKIQTRVDIKKLHAQTSSTAFRRHSFSDYLLRSRNMDTEQGTRKNDSIDATQEATTHYQTKRKYKKIEKQDIEPKEENGNVDITEMCSSDDESGDGQSTKSHRKHKEKHCRRIGQDGTRKDSCWNRTHKK